VFLIKNSSTIIVTEYKQIIIMDDTLDDDSASSDATSSVDDVMPPIIPIDILASIMEEDDVDNDGTGLLAQQAAYAVLSAR
jgi:hypothetical protein